MPEKNHDRSAFFPAIEKKYGQPMSYWHSRMAELKDAKYQEQLDFLMEGHGFSRAHANALVMYSRGSTTSKKFNTVEDYLKPFDEEKKETVRLIVKAITKKFPKVESIIAWNKPMFRIEGMYVFGISVATSHILIMPFNAEVLKELAPLLEGYEVNKKTIRVPTDWDVDVKLIQELVKTAISA